MKEISIRELDLKEISEVSGGLNMSTGGMAIMTLGIAAGPIGLGGFALGLGLTLLVGGTMAEEGYS